MKIAYVVEDAGLSGGAKVIMEHCSRLSKRGHEITLFTVAPNNPRNWFPGLDQVNIRYTGSYPTLQKALTAYTGHKVATWWKTARSVAGSGGKCFYLVQDIESSYATASIEAQDTLSTYNLPLVKITNGNWVTSQLTQAHNVGIGIDHSVFTQMNLERSKNGVLYNYRGHFLKNPKLFMETLPLLDEKLTTVIFGVDRPPLTPRQNYVGYISESYAAQLYNMAGVYVSTSDHEGFCLPVLEAMACGCPVVTTNSDANMEFCIHEVNCLVADKTAESVSRSINRLLANEALAKRLACEGLLTARKYQWEKVVDNLEIVFASDSY